MAGSPAAAGSGNGALGLSVAGGERPADASLCMTCPVRASCIGNVAAQVGSRELLGVLAGWRRLAAGAALLLPPGALYAVRSGSLKSLALGGVPARPRAFHFAGEVVGGGPAIRLVALQDTELCALRQPVEQPSGAMGTCSGRVWDMSSRELVRERALASCLAALPPERRVQALLVALSLRARAPAAPGREVRLFLTMADVAGYLQVDEDTVDRALADLAARGVLQRGVHQLGVVRPDARLASRA